MNENNNYNTIITRGDFEDDILEQVKTEIQETILHDAPESWSKEHRDAISENVLDHTRLVLDALSSTELQSEGALRSHIAQAIAETKRLIHRGGVRRTNS
jgi:hypothetical protein